MGIFGSKPIEDKPLEYHACTVATLIGLQMGVSTFRAEKERTGGAIASVLNLYAGTLPAPALLNHLAIGAGSEFTPSWDKEFVRDVVTRYESELLKLKDTFDGLTKGTSQEIDIARRSVECLGYSADVSDLSQYEDGLISLSLGVIGDLAIKVKNGTRNGNVNQDANDAYMQGVVAALFISVLLICERLKRQSA